MLSRPVVGAVPDCLQVDAVIVVAVEVGTPLAVGEAVRVADVRQRQAGDVRRSLVFGCPGEAGHRAVHLVQGEQFPPGNRYVGGRSTVRNLIGQSHEDDGLALQARRLVLDPRWSYIGAPRLSRTFRLVRSSAIARAAGSDRASRAW